MTRMNLGQLRTRPSLNIKDKAKAAPKRKPKRAGSAARSNTPGRPAVATRAAFIMPSNRYPVMVEGAHNPQESTHYILVFNVVRAVQCGAGFSSAADKKSSKERGHYVTSGIPCSAILQIRNSLGQCFGPNTMGSLDCYCVQTNPTSNASHHWKIRAAIVGTVSCGPVII